MKILIEESKKIDKHVLKNYTLHEFIYKITGSLKLANDMRNVFGYD